MTNTDNLMPTMVGGDYVQTKITLDEDNYLEISVYPLKYFRCSTEEIGNIFTNHVSFAKKRVHKHGVERVTRELNIKLNASIREMEEKGSLIVGSKDWPNAIMVNDTYRPAMSYFLHDGYTSFGPGMLPPVNSSTYH